jgi:hypothetical protein
MGRGVARVFVEDSRVSKGSWTSEQGQKVEGSVAESVFIELLLRFDALAKICKNSE